MKSSKQAQKKVSLKSAYFSIDFCDKRDRQRCEKGAATPLGVTKHTVFCIIVPRFLSRRKYLIGASV